MYTLSNVTILEGGREGGEQESSRLKLSALSYLMSCQIPVGIKAGPQSQPKSGNKDRNEGGTERGTTLKPLTRLRFSNEIPRSIGNIDTCTKDSLIPDLTGLVPVLTRS